MITAVERWITTNRSRFYEMARRLLEEETPVTSYDIADVVEDTTVRELLARVEVLKAVGGTLAGSDLQQWDRALGLLTSTIGALKALDKARKRWVRGPWRGTIAKFPADLRKAAAA